MEDVDNTDTISTNVVGGDVVPESSYPYFVWNFGVGTTTGLCGGTLIHPDIVLTAANCSALYAPGGIVNIAGEPTNREIEKIFAHPAYIASTSYNDIMLVKLKGTTTTTPVTLNRFKLLSIPGRSVTVIGLKSTKADGSGELGRVTLRLMGKRQCNATFGALYDHKTELCAGVRQGDKGACVGDGGGPLLAGNVQHGISTYVTSPCGKAGASSGFNRVSRFYQWIWYYACELTAVKTGKCG